MGGGGGVRAARLGVHPPPPSSSASVAMVSLAAPRRSRSAESELVVGSAKEGSRRSGSSSGSSVDATPSASRESFTAAFSRSDSEWHSESAFGNPPPPARGGVRARSAVAAAEAFRAARISVAGGDSSVRFPERVPAARSFPRSSPGVEERRLEGSGEAYSSGSANALAIAASAESWRARRPTRRRRRRTTRRSTRSSPEATGRMPAAAEAAASATRAERASARASVGSAPASRATARIADAGAFENTRATGSLEPTRRRREYPRTDGFLPRKKKTVSRSPARRARRRRRASRRGREPRGLRLHPREGRSWIPPA